MQDTCKMKRSKIGKCICGGTLYNYGKEGFLPKTIKCDQCGVGESYDDRTTEKSIKEIVKLMQRGEW